MIRTVVLSALLAGSAVAADLPVKEVVLYKNGVGYFVRGGDLAPGESARLDFKAAEMNDVLKSLTVVEAGGGTITGLRYDSSEPLARKLSEFPFQLGPGQPLSALLDQLKGARIELTDGCGQGRGNHPGRAGDGRAGKTTAARADYARARCGGTPHVRPFRRYRDALYRCHPASAAQGLSGQPGRRALEGKAQRIHRFHRRQSAARVGDLCRADAGVEIELPAGLPR